MPHPLPEGAARCQAHSKTSGEQCRQPAVPGKRVCHWHGGVSPSGVASGRYKTGKYSKDAPRRLVQHYEQALHDPELLSQREELALLDSRLLDVLRRVDTGESGQLWGRLGSAWNDLQVAQRLPDAEARGNAMAQALQDIGEVITKGQTDWATWRELLDLMEGKRRLSESEQKRLVMMQQMVTAEQALVLVDQTVQAIKDALEEIVEDERIRRRVLSIASASILRLTHREDGPAA